MQDLPTPSPATYLDDDEVMAELRASRRAFAEAHAHDIEAMFATWRARQADLARQNGSLVVSLPPKRVPPPAAR